MTEKDKIIINLKVTLSDAYTQIQKYIIENQKLRMEIVKIQFGEK